MKNILGIIILCVSGGAFIKYFPQEDANQWIVFLLFCGVAIGFDMVVSSMIDQRIEKLRDELKDKFSNENDFSDESELPNPYDLA